MQGHAQIIEHRQVREHGGNLERAHDAAPSHLSGLQGGDVLAAMKDAAGARFHELGQKVEAGRLSRTVGSDQTVNRSFGDAELDVGNGDEPRKTFAQASSFNHVRHENLMANIYGAVAFSTETTLQLGHAADPSIVILDLVAHVARHFGVREDEEALSRKPRQCERCDFVRAE